MKFSPIILFTYNRLELTQKTVSALMKNELASESELYIFSDGHKDLKDESKVLELRNFLRTIVGFKRIIIEESASNRELANSVIHGVSKVFKDHNRVIVLEDDLVTSPNFLTYMNQALDFFNTDPKIFSISGYSPDLPHLKHYNKDYYLSLRASSWGWGTWKERWDTIDWNVEDYDKFKFNLLRNLEFAKGGSDLPGMLRDQKRGKIDSWAIRWVYNQFKRKQFTIYPKISKVKNIGIGEQGTHTKKVKRFEVKLDFGSQSFFKFENETVPNSLLLKEFKSIFSFRRRLLDRF